MDFRYGKIFVSQANLNRLYHGTHKPWQVLQNEGASLLVRGEGGIPYRLPKGVQPASEIVGVIVNDPDKGASREDEQRYVTNWAHKFLTSIPTAGESFRVKECRINGLPPLVAQEKR